MKKGRDDQDKIGLTYQKGESILTLFMEAAEKYKSLRVKRTTVPRIFIEERAALYRAGWGLNEPETQDFIIKILSEPTLFEVCKVIVDLPEEELKRLRALVDKTIKANG